MSDVKDPVATVVFEHHGPHVANPRVFIEDGQPVNEPHEDDCPDCRWHFNIIDTRPVVEGENSNAGASIAASDENEGFIKLEDAVKAAEEHFGEGSVSVMDHLNENIKHIYGYED